MYLCVLIAFALWEMWPSLFRAWFFSSDEYVFAFEVIRFIQRDFRQHFFDMPGTPLMMLASILWALYYGANCALGIVSSQRGILAFTLDRLPALFVLLRGMTVFFYCVSLVLLFRLAARLMNRPAAWVATFILAMSPLYATISSFVRVESLSICFMLAGFLVLVHALDRPTIDPPARRRWLNAIDPKIAAGLLIGLSMATRMHALTASLPAVVLLILLASRATPSSDYPRWVKVGTPLAAGALGVAGLLSIVGAAALREWPHAVRAIQAAVIGGFTALAIGTALYLVRRTRPMLIRIASPDLLRTLAGIPVGFVLGTPTVIRQYPFFLRSVEFYSTGYMDPNRAGWPFWKNAQWYVHFYLANIAPDRIALALLVAGGFWIALRRDRRLLPFLVAALLFFVSKPLALMAAPHHVVPWLPFYALVCGYPVAAMVEIGSRRGGSAVAVAAAGCVGIFAALLFGITRGPLGLRNPDTIATDQRLANIQRASDWIVKETDPRATVAVGFYCFNPGTFFEWLRQAEVPIPKPLDRRTYIVWWYGPETLQGLTGYVCMANADIDHAAKMEKLNPGRNVSPLTDRRFELAQSFGEGPNRVNVFRFDFRSDEARAADEKRRAEIALIHSSTGPIRVVAATYGENCHAPHGNSTPNVAVACDGKIFCEYKVDVWELGDPTPACGKNFVAEWSCGGSPTVLRAEIGGPTQETGYGSIVTLSCGDAPAK